MYMAGNWAGNCSSPKYVLEKLITPIEAIIQEIVFLFDGSPYSITKKIESLPWHVSGSYSLVRCYHLDMASLRNMSTSNLKALWLLSNNSYDITVNSPNAWKTIDPKEHSRVSAGRE